VVRSAGGSPSGEFALLTSTNATVPLIDWPTAFLGNFDWLGNATITNAINTNKPSRFFVIFAP
jgi:hypothetical protein